jgi:hypothetical protein
METARTVVLLLIAVCVDLLPVYFVARRQDEAAERGEQ